MIFSVLKFGLNTSQSAGSFRRDDNTVDRLNHRWTVIILCVFAIVSTAFQYVGEPITCWCPAEFEKGWIEYTNAFCWVNNTYYVHPDEEIPRREQPRHYVVYYQWVPFIFLGMAVCFYLPSVLWTGLNSKSGVNSDSILQTADNFRYTDQCERRERQLALITNQMDRFVGSRPKTIAGVVVKKRSTICSIWRKIYGRRFGNYLIMLYLTTKVLYLVNAAAQLVIMNAILVTDHSVYGIEALLKAVRQEEFLNHTIFPKVTYCDIFIRDLGVANTKYYTLQCLLPINLYTEKMFVFLWFWIALVILVTFYDLISWILRNLITRDRYNFIANGLLVSDCIDRNEKSDMKLCKDFVDNYLKRDGVHVLRLISENANKITSSEIIAELWHHWRNKNHIKQASDHAAILVDETTSLNSITMESLQRHKPELARKLFYPPVYRPTAPPPEPPNGNFSHYIGR